MQACRFLDLLGGSLKKGVSLVILCTTVSYGSEPEGDPSGWLWYQDPAEIPLSEERVEEEVQHPSAQRQDSPQHQKTAVDRLEDYKERYEEAKALAILEPTLPHIQDAQKRHNDILQQATDFQEMWNIAEVLDVSSERIATSPEGSKIERRLDKEAFQKDMKNLSKDYGFIFAFKEGCSYCHKFAPLVQRFSREHGFELKGLSKTGGCFEGMSCDQNVAAMEAINPKGEYPILYLANPKTNDVIPVTRGYANRRELEDNLRHVLLYLKKTGQE